LEKNKHKLLFNVHGHCHGGAVSDLDSQAVPVYNPGPLIAGHFMTITLLRASPTDKWLVSEYKHY